ncbi:sulfatase [Spongiactinospora sp. TRM90649]|uniref:sulfatase family protein n=1 Tax=Spongiactinospora sp. TRM90649 TaxID=3031114 RepID=UPI0023F8D315|nr:sulfatase [Spongiactinospora sp. TRM90649]MDF5758690.1 sulfatase [Spongiactinospora sp. TRM90649]
MPADAGAKPRPNIILVVADDLEASDLSAFPNIYSQLVRQGTAFERYFVTDSWCCPSRASILRSQYVHSHGVYTNTAPEGGFGRFHASGLESSTIGTWLKAAGYRTALMGKYLNHYPGRAVPPTYVPPGWDEWHVPVRRLYAEYGYTLNENGTLRAYGHEAADYLSDVLAAKAAAFVSDPRQPFFLYLAPIGPHQPANPAPRHADAFADAQAPRPPSFDQANVEAEPEWLRAVPRLRDGQVARIDERYRTRMRSMLGVDDLVGTVVGALGRSGRLADTYLFFTSDNGFHLGTHRLALGKTTPFEESIRVPLVARGPGIAAGRTVTAMAATVDLGPTFAELAGTRAPDFAEGRSLVPVLTGGTPSQWRKNVLVEFYRPPGWTPVPGEAPPYRALRTADHTYVEYARGERQLYDLTADPYQLDNVVGRTPAEVVDRLARTLHEMAVCSGASCRVADTR